MEYLFSPGRYRLYAFWTALVLAAVAKPAIAHAQSDGDRSHLQLELGIFGGGHFFANDLELGVADDPTLPSPKSNGLFGLRAALSMDPIFALEVEGVGVPTGDTKHDYKLLVIGYRAHLLANLVPLQMANGKLTPFVLAGAGALWVAYTVGTAYDEIKHDTDVEFHAGLGLKYAITPMVAFRFDARVLAVPNTTKNGVSPDYELMGGLAVTLGHRSPPEHVLAPVGAKDSDNDGIADDVDKCPNEPEDKDGFQDADGCPDPDNDHDGIADAVDKCPNEPEDKDGFQDADGCPDPDNDHDGIADAADKCPNDPEDKDGFEDADGCPDPDNDKDGILDASDKCPNDPETKNGYQDADGCPDEVPAAVAKFTGVIPGITFRKNSAEIAAASFPTLKAAVKIMKDYPSLRIEISGHTSNEGKHDANMKLSRQRADAVKAYLISASTDESRISSVGFGPDKPIADNKDKKGKEKNRRIEFRLLSQGESSGGAGDSAKPSEMPDTTKNLGPSPSGEPPAMGDPKPTTPPDAPASRKL